MSRYACHNCITKVSMPCWLLIWFIGIILGRVVGHFPSFEDCRALLVSWKLVLKAYIQVTLDILSRVCMYIYIYACEYRCICIYVYMYLFIYIHTYIYTFKQKYTFIHAYIHLCIHIYVCSCIYIHTYMMARCTSTYFNLRTQEVKANRCLWIQGQPGVCSKFQFQNSYSKAHSNTLSHQNTQTNK